MEVLRIDFPDCIAREFPDLFPIAWSSAEVLRNAVKGADFSSLERNSPGLRGFDWASYLHCSVVRVVRALRALSQHVGKPARILDFGAYFGNFALACREMGYQVDAADFYKSHERAFADSIECLHRRSVQILDFDAVGPELGTVPDASYDAVLCMGVIEHIAHTPRAILQTVNRVLKPAGILVLDTPNLAYIYKRKLLMRGESIFPEIATQFITELPFAGHHREYTAAEVRWMLEEMRHDSLSIEMFSYSLYSLQHLQNEDLENYRIMEKDPSSRELILSVSRKRL